MGSMPTDVLLLKLEGNTHTKNGRYVAAIKCYDQALKRARSEKDAIILLLNRCQARLQSQHYDAALSDALAIIEMSPKGPGEKALFRAGRALYGLQRWKEASDYFERVLAQNPKNHTARQDLTRCRTRRDESAGIYDFKSMLAEAVSKSPNSDMDRANFIGRVEVRDCQHGRGLFTTKAVEPGELLTCEKSFATVFRDPDEPVKALLEDKTRSAEDEVLWQARDSQNQLVEKSLYRLHRNPSLQSEFAKLYPGPDWVDEKDEKGLPILDDTAVRSRIIYNCFGFPIITHAYHTAFTFGKSSSTVPDDLVSSRGIWSGHSSYVNHSCYPTVRRSFIGNMMIFRAQCHIPGNTELKFGYISGLEERSERQKKLKNYGFNCDCQVCEAEGNTCKEMMDRRIEIAREIHAIFEKGESNTLETYTNLLDQMEATYVNLPTVEYRRAVITPLTNIITGCLTSDLPHQVIELTHRLLRALGYELEVTETRFQIVRWGFLIDEIVISLVDLVDGYKILRMEELSKCAESEAKMAYLIMCGEDVSWGMAYGKGGVRERANQCREDSENEEDRGGEKELDEGMRELKVNWKGRAPRE